ncbi:hypothetical protein PV08_07023 [Exophiala spinifera]|uniref:Glutathione S-transferase n=1 Tax=Exophiala spinifera TaxID=91928 RepID=A0A0D1YGX9_9EURO|nr:uncharacterized protein PV08_07023 [Exophiala spinifera]KIW14241.1 hypothetical protein PV08_07023 [Exophiala spinifera]
MADVHLYYAPGACSLASHILLHEAGVPFTSTRLSVRPAFPDEYAYINSKKRVPVLSLNGKVITENPAIMLAISQLVPEKELMGETDLDKVRVLEWMNWLSGSVHGQAYGMILRPSRFADRESMHPGIREQGIKTLKNCFDQIESWLAKDQQERVAVYALGDGQKFSAVDGYLYIFYRWAMGLKLEMQTKYPRYSALVRMLESRDTVKQTLQAEGLEVVM